MEKIVENIMQYWDEHSSHFDEDHDTEDKSLWKSVLKEHLGNNENITVVDLGTGTGFLANMTSELGYNTMGFDMSKEMLTIAKRYAKEKKLNVNYEIGSVENLGLGDNSIDAIMNCRLVWTLTDPQKAFKEWNRVLKVGGKVLNFIRIGQENEIQIKEVYGKEIDNKLPLKNASKKMLIEELEKANFTNIEAVELPQRLTIKGDYDPWFVIKGIKRGDKI